ncbi:MAG: hypothetical protein AAGB01_05320 [Cyanobacteria bacterium P01_F01_bin.42]
MSPLNSLVLEPQTRQRLTELELWPWLYTELLRSGRIARGFAQSIRGTLVQEAIAQISEDNLDLALSVKKFCEENQLEAALPQVEGAIASGETDFRRVARQNNLMCFLACGLYELALKEDYLQSDVMNCWNQILDVQASHALFVVNWLSYESQAKQKPEYELAGLFALWELRSQWLPLFNKLNRSEYNDNLPDNPGAVDYFLGRQTFTTLLDMSEAGYRRRLESFDPQLIRPSVVARTSQFVRGLVGFWPQRVIQTRPSSV